MDPAALYCSGDECLCILYTSRAPIRILFNFIGDLLAWCRYESIMCGNSWLREHLESFGSERPVPPPFVVVFSTSGRYLWQSVLSLHALCVSVQLFSCFMWTHFYNARPVIRKCAHNRCKRYIFFAFSFVATHSGHPSVDGECINAIP